MLKEKLDATTARMMIWEELRKVASPDSRFSWNFAEFITDYKGSDKCAELLCQQEFYKRAQVIFITPDNNLEVFREMAIRDGKTILMTNYGITRGVFLIRPEWIPKGKEDLAATLDGVQRFWKHMTLKKIKNEIRKIDFLVTGASAITPAGLRFGKGHGYFDLEWAMFYTIGVVSKDTPVVAVGHDCQIVDVDLVAQPYDTAIDYIITPTKVIRTRNEFPKPDKGIIWSMLAPGMLEQIPPLQELWCENFCK